MLIELDKSIIELIGDYMDKTLSEGCLYLCNTFGIKQFLGKHINRQRSNWNKEYRYVGIKLEGINIGIESEASNYYDNDEEFEKEFKILGHYDITAVLNYISKKIPVISIENERMHSHLYKDGFWCSDVIIPNKPLNLYTEEEKKNLLDLLKKLK